MFERLWIQIPAPVCWMDMTFFYIDYFVKIVLFCLKKLKINYKEAGVGPFKKNKE